MAEPATPESLWVLANHLRLAARALDRLPLGARAGLDALLDEKVYPGDLGLLADRLKAMADNWQAELDAAEGDACDSAFAATRKVSTHP